MRPAGNGDDGALISQKELVSGEAPGWGRTVKAIRIGMKFTYCKSGGCFMYA
jgi:hypothetical protein